MLEQCYLGLGELCRKLRVLCYASIDNRTTYIVLLSMMPAIPGNVTIMLSEEAVLWSH